jgi:uridine phosphorylase
VIAHLRPSAPIAADALLPGDPGRALLLAQELLAEPKMSNHARGLWGYHGQTESGRELTIQSTGIGGPSAAIVLSELAELGVRRAVRVGTCGALDRGLELGELLAVSEAIARDGASRELGADGRVGPDGRLGAAVGEAAAKAGGRSASVASVDLFHRPPGSAAPDLAGGGAAAWELECATLFALGERLGVATAALLVVSSAGEPPRALGQDELEQRAKLMGRAALAALGEAELEG